MRAGRAAPAVPAAELLPEVRVAPPGLDRARRDGSGSAVTHRLARPSREQSGAQPRRDASPPEPRPSGSAPGSSFLQPGRAGAGLSTPAAVCQVAPSLPPGQRPGLEPERRRARGWRWRAGLQSVWPRPARLVVNRFAQAAAAVQPEEREERISRPLRGDWSVLVTLAVQRGH